MELSYDEGKRQKTLIERGLDFEDARKVFAGPTFEVLDDRQDYGEQRFQTIGLLDQRLVMVVWTPRGRKRHILSMRKCNDREQERYGRQLGS